MTRVLICGDRNWTDGELIGKALDERPDVTLVIHGAAKGADSLADLKAQLRNLPVLAFKAKWDEYGRAAGPIRNKQMLDEGKPDEVWAFHEDLESSKGTKNMVGLARKAGLPVHVFDGTEGDLEAFLAYKARLMERYEQLTIE